MHILNIPRGATGHSERGLALPRTPLCPPMVKDMLEKSSFLQTNCIIHNNEI